MCKSGGADIDIADFQTPLHNSYYRVVRRWRESPEGRATPISHAVADHLAQTAPASELGPAEQFMFKALFDDLARQPMTEFRDCVSRGLGY